MPRPWSRTAALKVSAVRVSVIKMVPPGLEYFTALSKMLTNTCRSRAGSAHTGYGSGGSLYSRCSPSRRMRASTNRAASVASATRSSTWQFSLMPFCRREKSSSSSTMVYRRSVSVPITAKPRRQYSLLGSSMLPMVSTQPLMEVSGVRSSWLTEEINSFFSRSVSARSPAIWLMVLHSRPISSS